MMRTNISFQDCGTVREYLDRAAKYMRDNPTVCPRLVFFDLTSCIMNAFDWNI